MYFSTYSYYNTCFISRFLLQKHYTVLPQALSISLLVSSNNVRSLEDTRLLNSFLNLELLSGQKPVLSYAGTRYVGTTKKAFFLSRIDLQKKYVYLFLEELSLFLLPYFQKRFGRDLAQLSGKTGKFVLSCKDCQLFQGYPYNYPSDCVVITINSSLLHSSFTDLFQLYKFNFAV